MIAFAFVAMMLVEPPVAGRPVDFSGAVGGPFVISTKLDSIGGTVDEPITLTLSITGPGDLSRVRRPNLKANPEYSDRFTIDDADERTTGKGREFAYILRPRSHQVMEVPRVKFVYFNPRVQPASRGWQTTYAESLSIRVNQRSITIRPLPEHVKQWIAETRPKAEAQMDRYAASHRRLRWLFSFFHDGLVPASNGGAAWPLWLIPPAVCLVWAWSTRRGQGKCDPIRDGALAQLAGEMNDPGRQIAAAVLGFLHTKGLIPTVRATPSEVGVALERAGIADHRRDAMIALLRECERCRFAEFGAQGRPQVDSAIALIRDWRSPE